MPANLETLRLGARLLPALSDSLSWRTFLNYKKYIPSFSTFDDLVQIEGDRCTTIVSWHKIFKSDVSDGSFRWGRVTRSAAQSKISFAEIMRQQERRNDCLCKYWE